MPSKDQDLSIIHSYWFPQVFAHCKAIAGAMFCRLWAYSDEQGQCYMTIPRMQQELGEGYRPVVSAKLRLEECGLISTCTEKYIGGLRTKVQINLNHPFLHKGDMSETGICAKRTYVQNEQGGTCEMNAPSKRGYLQNARRGTCKMQGGVLAKCKEGYLQNAHQYTDINTDINTGVNTEVVRNQNFNLDADIDFYERQQELLSADFAPDAKEQVLIGNHTSTPDKSILDKTSACLEPINAKPDETKKKKERKPRPEQLIPQNSDEVVPYIEKFLKRHENEEGYKNLDVTYYAGSILDFYLKDDGTWRDNKYNLIHEPYRKVSSWISKDLQEGRLKRTENERMSDSEVDDFMTEMFAKIDARNGTTNNAAPVETTFEFVEEHELLEQKHD